MIFDVRREQNFLLLILMFFLGACSQKPEIMLASAKDYLIKNDSNAAIIQIKNVLQTNPNNSEARFLLGDTLLDVGDPVGAETELRKALNLSYPSDAAIPLLAQAMLAQGQSKKLIEEFAHTELTLPRARASLKMSLASAYAAQNKFSLAETALNAAVMEDPNYAPARIAQVRQKAATGNFDGALIQIDEVISKSSQNADAWKLKGDILQFGKNQIENALAAYRQANEIKPNFLPSQVAIATLLLKNGDLIGAKVQIEKLNQIAHNSPQVKYLEALLAYRNNDFKSAKELLQFVLKSAPNNVQSLQLAGAVEFQLNAPAAAEGYLSKALQSLPTSISTRHLLAMTYLRSGRSTKAIAILQPILDQENVDSELLFVAGEAFLQNGDLKQAEKYFEDAVRQSPQDGRKKTALALTHIMLGSADASFDELKNITISDSGVTADLALISVHMKRQEFEKALIAIGNLEKKQPNKPLAFFLRAQALLAMRNNSDARKNFEHALTLDPDFFGAVAGLARMDLNENKSDIAKRRFESVVARNPKNNQAWLALAELAARTGASPGEIIKLITNSITANPSDQASRLALTKFHLLNKNSKQALLSAQNAVAALPDSAEVLEALGLAQQASGELNQAIVSFGKLSGMQPLSPVPHLRLAYAHYAKKDNEAARNSLRKALSIRSDFIEAQRLLIAMDMEKKDSKAALETARTIQQQRPKDAVGYLLEGNIYISQKNWTNAIGIFRAGLKRINTTELAIKLHSILLTSNKNEEADKFSYIWQKEHPKDTAFFFYLGDMAIASQKYDLAEKYYIAVTQLQPDNASAYNNLAWLSSKLDTDAALDYAEKANSLAPNRPLFMDTMATLLSNKGDHVKAIALQTRALALQPGNPLLRFNLAKIYMQDGKNDLAKKELEELRKLGDKFPAHAEVVAFLKTL